MSIGRYIQTVRHLKAIQIVDRIRRRLVRPRIDTVTELTPRPVAGPVVEPWRPEPSLTAPDRARFLNDERDIAGPEAWRAADRPLLWTYNLHYFDDLNARAAAERETWHRALIRRWIDENPPGAPVAWDPYTISLRLVNWIRWLLAGNDPEPGMLLSLCRQARWLERTVEHHLQGNHLLANAKGLVFAGAFFAGAEADRWLSAGRRLLDREHAAQILADGGHEERSPMYQAILLADVLDLIALERALDVPVAGGSDRLPDLAIRMHAWLRIMSHPDGDIAFFNDAALGIAPTGEDLAGWMRRLGLSPAPADPGEGVHHLADSGYVRLQRRDAVLLMDVGEVGPAHQPGHAHADTLSIELSLAGRRVIVNGGTSTYAVGAIRDRERSTPNHSTVGIGTRNSSDVWGGFRVGWRAKPRRVRVGGTEEVHHVDGLIRYARATVRRRVFLSDDRLIILDNVAGPGDPAIARFHLHPDLDVEPDRAGERGLITDEGRPPIIWNVIGGTVRIVEGKWAPAFGRRIPNRYIETTTPVSGMTFSMKWQEAT